MKNISLKSGLTILLVLLTASVSNAQYALYQLANSCADRGNYQEAIRIMKDVANQEIETEYYIDDIASIAEFYSYTEHTDSLMWYNNYTQQLAEKFGNDSIAEIYIQSTAWNYDRCGLYERALETSKRVLELRERVYGLGSEEWHDWLGVIMLNAFKNLDFENLSLFSQLDYEVARDINGIESRYVQESLAMIRAYGHQYVDNFPDFVITWVSPYYQILKQNDILRQYQYEFEILIYEANYALDDLKNCQVYYNELNKWLYPGYDDFIPTLDKARIWIKLSNFDNLIGDSFTARWRIEEGWKLISENIDGTVPMELLIDRCNAERLLRTKPNGDYGIYSEWLIENTTPIILANEFDEATMASFYETRAWAYEGIEDWEKATSDMITSIRLMPLISREKKLAQMFMKNKEYAEAENLYLRVLENINGDSALKRSTESDLMALYWLWNKKDKLEKYLKLDFENIKTEVRDAFAFMNEFEREKFLNQSSLGGLIHFDLYTGFSNNEEQWDLGNQYAYNLALIQKGLLLSTIRDIKTILSTAPESLQKEIKIYNEFQKNKDLSLGEDPISRDIRLKFMKYVSIHPDFLSQLNYNWEDVRNSLNEGEVAVEFINLSGFSPEKLNEYDPGIGALLITSNSDYPIFVYMTSNILIENLFEFDEEGHRMDDLLYKGESRKQLFSIIWEPLLPYLQDIKTIYYSPTGLLQSLNLDWLGRDEENLMIFNYDLYRLSSTREICHKKTKNNHVDVVLYGNITYSVCGNTPDELPKSRYRSTTRAGFSSLPSTAIELNFIMSEFIMYNIKLREYTKNIATEKTFRDLSEKSPKILHIATHGFYFSEENLIEEFKKSSFMGFQYKRPELYHSGLAFFGAQDTWINENAIENTVNFDKYFKIDSENDGILLSAEISQMDLSGTDLVVLSACETALGSVKSDGVYGLQRAFKMAGVNSILMSLWKVDDDATQLLMTEFYKNYLGGMSKKEALQEAQKKVKNTPGFKDPYYWAAFILLDALN